MILMQTVALLRDAYRELNAKKLFWVTLGLSAAVVLAFMFITINAEGIKLFGMQTKSPYLNTNYISVSEFYRILFIGVAIPYWLAWPAVILALISTAGVVPELVSGGSIEGSLSKPISRSRLFLTKVFGAMLFTALQVLLFTVGWFLVIGIRTGDWSFTIFLAVPLVVVFYSYLYAVCALIGLITRSTITALLLTLLFWLALWGGNWADIYFLGQREGTKLIVEDIQADIEESKKFELSTEDLENDLREAQADARSASLWFTGVSALRTILPKTSETTNLLERYLLDLENEEELMDANRQETERQQAEAQAEIPGWFLLADPRVSERIGEARQERSVFWIIGTSLLFEAVILGLSCLIFVRRDF